MVVSSKNARTANLAISFQISVISSGNFLAIEERLRNRWEHWEVYTGAANHSWKQALNEHK